MRGLRLLFVLLFAVGLFAAALPSYAQSFPDYTSTTVNDFADLLPEAEERVLSDRLIRLERETGVELTVVTLTTQSDYAPGLTLEAFATALFNDWGVGKAETNDGVMVLVIRDDRAMRLELGAAYGRDWDRVAQDVVERHFLNAFGTGDYVRGLTWGTEQVIERIVMPFREGASPPTRTGFQDWLIGLGMFGLFTLALARRRIGDQLARFRRCPQCGRFGLRQVRSVTRSATRTRTGTGQRTRSCQYCDFTEQSGYTIPIRRSSSGGGGSFGGGRSGGGGASGRW